MDQKSDTHQKKTRQVDELRQKVLSTFTRLWLLTIRRSDTWWTIVPKKAAAVAEASTKFQLKIVFWWIYVTYTVIYLCISTALWSRWVLNELRYTLRTVISCSTLADSRSYCLHCLSFGHPWLQDLWVVDSTVEIGSTIAAWKNNQSEKSSRDARQHWCCYLENQRTTCNKILMLFEKVRKSEVSVQRTPWT